MAPIADAVDHRGRVGRQGRPPGVIDGRRVEALGENPAPVDLDIVEAPRCELGGVSCLVSVAADVAAASDGSDVGVDAGLQTEAVQMLHERRKTARKLGGVGLEVSVGVAGIELPTTVDVD